MRHELTRKMGTAPLQQTTTHTIIRQIERERDEAREESRRLRVERDSLQDRLKVWVVEWRMEVVGCEGCVLCGVIDFY